VSVDATVTVEVRRTAGLTARRNELDGFAGAMTRLRGAYDALRQTYPVSDPPEMLVDAMQAGDRLGYHPEHAQEEIARLREVLPQAQAEVAEIQKGFAARMEEMAKQQAGIAAWPVDMEAQKRQRQEAAFRAKQLVTEANR
jgi:hypothetical protein